MTFPSFFRSTALRSVMYIGWADLEHVPLAEREGEPVEEEVALGVRDLLLPQLALLGPVLDRGRVLEQIASGIGDPHALLVLDDASEPRILRVAPEARSPTSA